MYALTCPSCNDVRHVPFVRAGAVTRCPACGNQWAIKPRHVERQERRATERPAAPVPPPKKEDLGVGGLDEDPKGGSSVSGLSGLSDLMQDVPKPKPKPEPTPPAAAPPPPAPARSSGDAANAPASPAAASSAAPARETGAAALSTPARAGIAVALAVLLGLLAWAALGGGDAPPSGAGDTSAPSPAAAPAGGGEPVDAQPAAVEPAGPPAADGDGPRPAPAP